MMCIIILLLLLNLLQSCISKNQFDEIEKNIEKISNNLFMVPPQVAYIVDGSEVVLGQIPFIVSLQVEGKHVCGGNLIDMDTIVTAAHCLNKVGEVSQFVAVAGIVNLKVNSLETKQISQVIWGLPHKDFYYGFWQSDIALLKVSPCFVETSYVKSINLPPDGYEPSGIGQVAGFGATASDEPLSDKLLATILTIFPKKKCRYYYGEEIDDTVFCAAGLSGHADTCQGDSGGPLICGEYLCGVIASGIGCGNQHEAGIYTKVSHFNKWIKTYLNTEILVVEEDHLLYRQ